MAPLTAEAIPRLWFYTIIPALIQIRSQSTLPDFIDLQISFFFWNRNWRERQQDTLAKILKAQEELMNAQKKEITIHTGSQLHGGYDKRFLNRIT